MRSTADAPADENNPKPEVDVDTTNNTTGNQTTTTSAAAPRHAFKIISISKTAAARLRRRNLTFRVLTFVCTLAAVVSTLFAEQTDSSGWTMNFTATSSLMFFMVVNVFVSVYSFCLSGVAFFTWMKGSGLLSTRGPLIMILVWDRVGVVFLVMAFASAMTTVVTGYAGYYVSESQDNVSYGTQLSPGICDTYGTFCSRMASASGFCLAGIISFMTGTALNAYTLCLIGFHRRLKIAMKKKIAEKLKSQAESQAESQAAEGPGASQAESQAAEGPSVSQTESQAVEGAAAS
ncbi:unnamed protein product [Calypogeia fissa]